MCRFPRAFFLLLFTVLSFTAVPASAQAPKVGSYYEDSVDLGFRVKMPKDWEFTPPQPGEANLIGKYTPANGGSISISPENWLWLEAYLVKFDRRADYQAKVDAAAKAGEPAPAKPGTYTNQQKDLLGFLDRKMIGNGFRVEKSKAKKIDKIECTEYLIKGTDQGDPFNVYAMVYRLTPEVDIAVMFNGPEKAKKWRKYASAAAKMAKTFKHLEVKGLKLTESKASDSGLRSIKRAALEKEVALTPGWKLYETDNYFVISNRDDREFIKELLLRLEAIRGIYEELYPYDAANKLKAKAAERRREEEGDEAKKPGDRETTSGYTSRQRSQTSVVRVCKNRTQYHEYGGPGGSAGYWHSGAEELVIYDDQEGGGRRNTWATLNHEAFHQYIFYLYGSISPHSWYNEGTGDFFAGYQYKNKKFKLKRFEWRVRLIQSMLKEGRYVPLEELVRYTQGEYYGTSEYKTTGGDHYAEGWSFIYFLRTGKGKAPKWDNSWNGILDTYFEVLAGTEDLDAAVDAAFKGVDWEAMEASWKAYIL